MNSTNNLNLYQLGIEHQKLLSQLYDYETGEINMEVDAQLNQVIESTEKKCEIMAGWMQSLDYERVMLDNMLNELEKRRESYVKKIDGIHGFLKSNMERCGIKEIRHPLFTVRLRKNPYSTDIFDETLIPQEFMRTKEVTRTETKPDRIAIKEEVLKTGIQVPGAIVQQKNELKIIVEKV